MSNVTNGYDFTTADELAAYVFAAETAGLQVSDPLDPAKDVGVLEFIGKVILAIGNIPVVSAEALKLLPKAVQDQVSRAHEVQVQKAAAGADLTPPDALCVAQANSAAGKPGWKYLPDWPLGDPLEGPLPGAPFTHP
jgi:hypothetical protein